jgi:prenyltransferase beta subunit
MTWQLGAFAILAVALAGGFAWYERARPDARIAALVGTLAALAALGRIAFAALPNVKPTTDIVLASGYALGGAPGFAVGALAGLSSNFFFGQGPWTPWQMAGWGATGALGALLAVATRRQIGRWPLALVCAVVGFAFTALQDVGDWVTYSDHSAAQLGIYVGRGIGFDFVHAGGCLVFALAFGPALIRSLTRFSARLQVIWEVPKTPARSRAGRMVVGVLAALVLGGWLAGQPGAGGGGGHGGADGLGGAGGVATAQAADTPAGYLNSAQNADGGFGPAPGQPSEQLFSGWVALGLGAAGENPLDVVHYGHSLIDYIRGGVGSASDPGSLARTILAVRAAGLLATSFGGRNLVAALEGDIRRDGSVAEQVNLTAFAALALRAAGAGPSAAMLAWMIRQQDADGGFNFAVRGGSSDVDDTGAALEALAGAGGAVPGRARARAVSFIRRQQDRDGGFPSQPGSGSNAQSTAFAVQGLVASGADPASLHRAGAPSPLDYLRSLTSPDGHIRYSAGTDQTPTWVTAQALMALAEKPLPLSPVARRSAPAPSRRGARPPARPPAHPAAHPAAAGDVSRGTAAGTTPSARRPASTPRRPAAASGGARAASADWLAVDAGVLAALSLAPLGQG